MKEIYLFCNTKRSKAAFSEVVNDLVGLFRDISGDSTEFNDLVQWEFS